MAFLQLVSKFKLRFSSCQMFILQKRRYCKIVFRVAFGNAWIDRIPGCNERDEWSLPGTDIYVGTRYLADKKELNIKRHIIKLVELYKTKPSGNSE